VFYFHMYRNVNIGDSIHLCKIKFVLWICNGNNKCLFIIYYERFRLLDLCFLFSYNVDEH
jgi:hypothetical protein